MSDDENCLEVSVKRAAMMLGYSSRSTIYSRIESGDLTAGTDSQGRTTVTVASIEKYLANPPAGSWSRPDAEVASPAPASAEPDEELSSVRAENVRLRETVSRLQMVREKEAEARAAEAAANRHLRRALKKRGQALELSAAALAEMDELITLFTTPHTVEGAE